MSKRRRGTPNNEMSVSIQESEVLCGVCHQVMSQPCHCDCPCKRSFCRKCLADWIDVDRRCPSCNVSVSTDVFSCSKQWEDFLDNLPRSCPNSAECKCRRLPRKEMEEHARLTCSYRLIECTNEVRCFFCYCRFVTVIFIFTGMWTTNLF